MMNKFRMLGITLAMLAPLPLGGALSALAAPTAQAGPTVPFQGASPFTVAAGEYDLVYLVLDFAPGTGVPLHMHPGPVVVLVLQGEIMLSQEGTERVVREGGMWSEHASDVHTVMNVSSSNARLAASLLVPKGAVATTLVEGTPEPNSPLPGPSTVFERALPVTIAAGEYSLVSLVLDFSTGATIPDHMHPGPVIATILDGELRLRESAGDRQIGRGESWTEDAGDIHSVVNLSSANTRVGATVFAPAGAEVTTLVQQPTGMPRTGHSSSLDWLTLAAVSGCLVLATGVATRFSRASRNRKSSNRL